MYFQSLLSQFLCHFPFVSPYLLLFHPVLEPPNSPPNEATSIFWYSGVQTGVSLKANLCFLVLGLSGHQALSAILGHSQRTNQIFSGIFRQKRAFSRARFCMIYHDLPLFHMILHEIWPVTPPATGGSPDREARGQRFTCCPRSPRNIINLFVQIPDHEDRQPGRPGATFDMLKFYVPFLLPRCQETWPEDQQRLFITARLKLPREPQHNLETIPSGRQSVTFV